MKKLVNLTIAMILLTAFAIAEEPETSERDNIKARRAELTSTWNTKDYDGFVAIFDEEFMLLYGGNKPLTDREELRKDVADEVELYPNLKYNTKSMRIHGNYAYELGMVGYDYDDENGNVVRGEDDYLMVWKKDKEGAWKIQVDLYWETFSSEEHTESGTKAITARKAKLIEDWNNKDTEATLSVYGKNCTIIADGEDPLVNREKWAGILAEEVEGLDDLALNTTSLVVHDGVAYEIGTGGYSINDDPGKGEYVFVWKQNEKGNWKINVEAWWSPASDDKK